MDAGETEEYSPAEVNAIVEAALRSLEERGVVPLSFSDSELFARLVEILPTWLGQADAQLALADIREKLFATTSQMTLQRMHQVCQSCSACEDIGKKGGAMDPKWNIADPDIVLVVDNYYSTASNSQNIELLVQALKAAGLSSSRVMLTYASRCNFGGRAPDEALVNCTRYLHTEMCIVKPKLIIALGAMPYGIITGYKDERLKEVRGNIIWLGPFAVMGLYSLGYILKSRNTLSDAVSYLSTDLKRAYAFCYGE